MQSWIETLIAHADNQGDINIKSGNPTDKYILTPWDLCSDIVYKVKSMAGDMSAKTVLTDIVEIIPVLLKSGVKECNITYVAPYTFKGKIATRLGILNVFNSSLTVPKKSNLVLWENKNKMKFDIIIGNPPYQLGKNKVLYRSFVKKSLELSKQIVAMVTPASWNSAGMTPYKRTILNNGLVYYNYLGTKTFKDSQNDVCAFICNKNDKTGNLLVKLESEEHIISGVKIHGIIPHKASKSSSILSKLSTANGMNDYYIRGKINPEDSAPGLEKCIVRNGFEGKPAEELLIDRPSLGKGKHKVIIAYNSSIGNLGPAKYIDPSYSIGYAVAFFEFDTVNECTNFISYLNSKIVKFCIKNLKTSIQNAKNTFEKIPKLDFTRPWTDLELYTYFGLTPEEQTYVKETIK